MRFVAVAGERDEIQQLVGLAVAARPRGGAAHTQTVGDVVGDAHQRKQREILEDKRGRPLVRSDAGEVLAVQSDFPCVGAMKPEIIRRIVVLPHPLGPEKAEELAFGDGHRDIANRDGVVIGLGYVNEVEGAGHGGS